MLVGGIPRQDEGRVTAFENLGTHPGVQDHLTLQGEKEKVEGLSDHSPAIRYLKVELTQKSWAIEDHLP